MKSRKLLAYLLCSALLGFLFVSPIAAFAYQIGTATATFIPPSPTPTHYSYSCPVGTPAGWGTYTPSPLWDLTCSNCSIITTPTATPAWNGTGTPPPGCTPVPVPVGEAMYCYQNPTSTPTISATAVPTINYSVQTMYCLTSNCVQNNSHSVSVTVTSGYKTGRQLNFEFFNKIGSQKVYYKIVGLSGSTYQNQYENKDSSQLLVYTTFRVGQNTNNWQLDQTATYSSGSQSGDWWIRSFQGSELSGDWDTGLADLQNYNSSFLYLYVGPQVSGYAQRFYLPTNVVVTFSSDPLVLPPTATPAPTATPYFDTGYCSSIAPTISEFGFDLFRPNGSLNCNMGWNEWTVADYTMPAVQICFQPSDFGVIRMFGRDYEVGTMAMVAASAFIWRFLRTV